MLSGTADCREVATSYMSIPGLSGDMDGFETEDFSERYLFERDVERLLVKRKKKDPVSELEAYRPEEFRPVGEPAENFFEYRSAKLRETRSTSGK